MTNKDTVDVILADYDDNRVKSIMRKLQHHPIIRVVGIAHDYESLMGKVTSLKPQVVMMEFSLIDITAIGIVKEIEKLSLDVKVLVVSDTIPENLKNEIITKGVVGVIKPDELENIDIKSFFTRRGDFNTPFQDKQSIILTYNTKGGVGKSIIAANLAVALKQSPLLKEKKIALVDFDVIGANVSTLFHVPDKKAKAKNLFYWSELPEDIKMDDNDLESMMVKVQDGLMILPAPVNYSYSSKVTFDLATRVLKILKNHFDILIIDGAPNISPTVDAALMYATHILLVTNTERQSVKQLIRFVDLLTIQPMKQDDLSNVLDKTFVVINHTQSDNTWGMRAADISRTINRPLLREIPYSEYVKEALHGDSNLQAFDLSNNSAFNVEIKKLANDLVGAYPSSMNVPKKVGLEGGKRGSLFSKLSIGRG